MVPQVAFCRPYGSLGYEFSFLNNDHGMQKEIERKELHLLLYVLLQKGNVL